MVSHLGEEDVIESPSLLDERVVQVSVSDEEVLEFTTVRSVGHFCERS